MAEVSSNETALAYAVESSASVLPTQPVWRSLEPNSIGAFGAQPQTIQRSPISNLRQDRASLPVDATVEHDHEADLTVSAQMDFGESFLKSTGVGTDLRFYRQGGASIVAQPDVTTGFVVPALSAAQAAKIQFSVGGKASLWKGRGYANAANNALVPNSAAVVATDTLIPFSTAVTETAPTNAEAWIAGVRCEPGDLAISIGASNTATLTSNNNAVTSAVDFTTLGLTVGQRIHVGGMADLTNRFGSTAANDATTKAGRSYGSARITSIAANSLGLDKIDALTLVASDGTDDGNAGTLVAVDLLFSFFVRNVPTADADFARQTVQFESSRPNLYETDPPTSVANPDGFQYQLGNEADEMTVNKQGQNKATVNFGFIGRTADNYVDNASRKTNASAPVSPVSTQAFNTANDLFRLRIANYTTDAALVEEFENLTTTIGNNVNPEKALGTFGNRFVNLGNFVVSIGGVAYLTSADIAEAVQCNNTVTADWGVVNADGAIHVDIPSMKLEDGAEQVELNRSVRINLTGRAFVDQTLQTSIGLSIFACYPEPEDVC